MDSSSGSRDCYFCEAGESKYTCPRCNMDYCSVDCYKSPKHLECSEAFYKEHVEEEMRRREPDPATARKTMEMLLRRYQEEIVDSDGSQDSDDEDELEQRLGGIDLDDTTQVWSRLTAEERKNFLDMANCGDITKLVPLWEPWWSETHIIPKVKFADSPSEWESYKNNCPLLEKDIPPLEKLSKSRPSPLVFNNIMNVLASYAMVTRFLNGEHKETPEEAASLLLDLSKNLSNNVTYDTLELAIESVCNESINNPSIGATLENTSQMKSDVGKISLGPNEKEPAFYVLAALSDVSYLLSSAAKSKKGKEVQVKTPLPVVFEKKNEVIYNRKQFALAQRKIIYYLSWATSAYPAIIDQLSAISN